MTKVKFHNSILCDMIRREDNGKLLLIGVYGGDVLLQSYPTTLNIAVHAEGVCLEAGALDAEFHFTDSDGNALAAPSHAISPNLEKGAFSAPINARIVVQRRCEFSVSADIGGEKHLLLTKSVMLRSEFERQRTKPQ